MSKNTRIHWSHDFKPRFSVRDALKKTPYISFLVSRDPTLSTATLDSVSSVAGDSERSDELTSILECPVCLDTMSGCRIYQCRNGHNVCERCSSNPALVSCPQCREPYRSVRACHRKLNFAVDASYVQQSVWIKNRTIWIIWMIVNSNMNIW